MNLYDEAALPNYPAGPMPLLMEYLDRYIPEQARSHEVKPGMTGKARGSHNSWRLTLVTICSAFYFFNKHGWKLY